MFAKGGAPSSKAWNESDGKESLVKCKWKEQLTVWYYAAQERSKSPKSTLSHHWETVSAE